MERAVEGRLDRTDVTGPWPLDVWGRRIARAARLVPWEAVEIHDDHIACAVHAAELQAAYP